jgi:hypothetical protein
LAVLNLGGFGGSRNMNILNISSLWERRARSKKSMILKGKQAESYKTNNDQRKLRRIKTAKYTLGKGCSESK